MESLAGDEARSQLAGTPAGTGWRWRTFPVYFAFSLGAFLGLYLGVIAQVATDQGNNLVSSGIFIAIALMLGLGFSRLSTRWLTSRRWIKQREAKR